jgi:hypothetical protein
MERGCSRLRSDANANTTNTNVVVDTNENTNVIVVNENTNSDQGSEVDTSDWLTYINEEYGFSFKYPEEWTVSDQTTQSKSWIIDGANLHIIQIKFDDILLLSILPEGQFDHDINPDMKVKSIKIGGKSGHLKFTDSYKIYSVDNYPKSDSEFRVESHTENEYQKSTVEKVIQSIQFNS